MRRHLFTRLAATALITLVGATLTACGEDEPVEQPTDVATASPEADATAAHQRYWDVYVQLANSGDVDNAAFEGVAEGGFVETDLKLLADQAAAGVVRVGQPTFSDFRTEVDGDSATSLVCIDESGWGAKKDGEALPPPSDGAEPSPFEATLTQRDGTWIVTDLVFDEDAPCP